MAGYLPPDYIDNSPESGKLSEVLRRLILDFGQNELDVATGFFSPKVWAHVREGFEGLQSLRLLIGRELAPKGTAVNLEEFFRALLTQDVEGLVLNQSHLDLVKSLIRFLEKPEVQVRLHGDQYKFFHAKAYIFPEVAIVGSSNLTADGVEQRPELNLVRKERGVAQELRDKWFQTFWDGGEDYKQTLIDILKGSKFGEPRKPFDVYIKALYELMKDRIGGVPPDVSTGVELASFQEEAFREAVQILETHGGVMVSDAVGLGKTYVGLKLLDHYVVGKRRKGRLPKAIVICPAQVRELIWNPRLQEYGLPRSIEVISQEALGREDFDTKRYKNVDLVLVDESHNFRNSATQRFLGLMQLLSSGKRDKRVVLMTATPINTSLYDLYHQVLLVTRGDEGHYRDIGIRNLQHFFRQATKQEAELFDLLEECMIRRSRLDIKRRQAAGEKIELPGKGEIRFPERQLVSVTYDLGQAYKGFYHQIADSIEMLNLASYNLEAFRRKDEDKEAEEERHRSVQRSEALIGLMKTLFLKRLESSVAAFEASVRRQIQFQGEFLKTLRKGRLLDTKDFRKIMSLVAVESGEEQARVWERVLQQLPEISPSDYDLDKIEELSTQDQALLSQLLEWVKSARQGSEGVDKDAKLDVLKDLLSGELKGKKVLVFSYFEETAKYLKEQLTSTADGGQWLRSLCDPRIAIITGETPPGSRTAIVRRFAPVSNTTGDEPEEVERLRAEDIQILISTDVLSEGQNLQDAGHLVNYDLHWNPVRMIQRAGRIDRIGSPFDELYVYNFFPETELDQLLRLVQRLQTRISDIDRSVGLDASVLGEVVSPKSFEQIKRVRVEDRKVLEELEETAELTSFDVLRYPLIQALRDLGEDYVKDIPLGVHSVKAAQRTHKPGVFFAFRATDPVTNRNRHFWRFYPDDEEESTVTDKRRLAAMIESPRTAPLAEPDRVIFPLLKQATEDLLRGLKRADKQRAISSPRPKGANEKFHTYLNAPNLFEQVEPQMLGRINFVLDNKNLHFYRKNVTLKRLLADVKSKESPVAIAEQLDEWLSDMGLYDDYATPTVLERIKEDDVQLVCYEVIVPSQSP